MNRSEDSLKKRVYDQILDKIVKKEFPVDAILIEGKLAEMFGVSKAPVREALVQLCSEDVLQSIPRAGYRIVQLTQKDFDETVELRTILELAALRRIGAVDERSLEELKAYERQGRWVARGEKDVALETWWQNNVAFHLSLSALAGNRRLTEALRDTLCLHWRVIAQLYWGKDPSRYLSFESEAHVLIIDALVERDLAKAEKALTEDMGALTTRAPRFWN